MKRIPKSLHKQRGWIGLALAAAGTLYGGQQSRKGQQGANRMNLKIAREQMAFQERMSSSAHQRAARDLEKAGLNRILALGQSASTPGGASATMVNPEAALGEAIGKTVSSAMEARTAKQNLSNMKALENETVAKENKVKQDRLESLARTALILEQKKAISGAAETGKVMGNAIKGGKTALADIEWQSLWDQAKRDLSSVAEWEEKTMRPPKEPKKPKPKSFFEWADHGMSIRSFRQWEKTPAGQRAKARYNQYVENLQN